MGLFGKKASAKLPALSDRAVKFVKGELVTHLWSVAGESSPKQNKTHRENIIKVLDKYAPKRSDRYETTAHLIVKGEQVLVQMHGMIVDELVAESVAKVRNRLNFNCCCNTAKQIKKIHPIQNNALGSKFVIGNKQRETTNAFAYHAPNFL